MERSNDLKSAAIVPVIISFSEPHLVVEWKKATRCTFEVYCDPTRAIYNAYGLKRSLRAVMGCSVMRYYGQLVSKGQTLPDIGEKEDTIQLGGDFTIDTLTNLTTFSYPSQTAKDRPLLSSILN